MARLEDNLSPRIGPKLKNNLISLFLLCFFVAVVFFLSFVLCQNAAMFPVDDPTSPPLIGPSTIVVVNDARHQLQPEFLQRTTPYFFDVDNITGQYKWAKVRRRGAVSARPTNVTAALSLELFGIYRFVEFFCSCVAS